MLWTLVYKYLFFFNWSIIALHCVSFCHTMKSVSYMCTCISFLSWTSLSPHPHPSHLGLHRAPSWAPCPVQQLPTSYLFHMYICVIWILAFNSSRYTPRSGIIETYGNSIFEEPDTNLLLNPRNSKRKAPICILQKTRHLNLIFF